MNLGIGISLTNYRSVPTVPIEDPDAAIAALFESGEVGAWYDPSDSTTVFQDSFGTTPAGVGDPVGLILDKSKGLVLGSELVTNGTFDTDTTGWSANRGASTLSVVSQRLRNTADGTAACDATYALTGLTVGSTYKITADLFIGTVSSFYFRVSNSATITSGGPISISSSSDTTINQYFVATAPTHYVGILGIPSAAGQYCEIDNISIKELPGNHATQSTSAARPILQQSGATPVLSGTELVTNGTFDADSDWTKGTGWSISGGQATHTGAAGYLSQNILTAGKVYKMTFDIVSAPNPATDFVQPYYNNSPAIGLFSSVGTHSVTATALSGGLGCALRGSGNVVIDNISVQEVTSWSGGLRYLDFDGVDDYMQTAAFASAQAQPITTSLGFKLDVYGGTQFIFDGIIFGTNRIVFVESSGNFTYFAGSSVNSGASSNLDTVGLFHYNTTDSLSRINGVQATSGANVGTNTWGSIRLGASYAVGNFLNGRIYSFVGVNRTLTAGEITDLETYLAAKSGVTL